MAFLANPSRFGCVCIVKCFTSLIRFPNPQPDMTNGVTFHQRINQQYNSLDEENRRRFDDLIGNLQRGGIVSIPASKRKPLTGHDTETVHTLWALRLSPDLRVIIEESDEALTVREIVRRGRIQFYRDLATQR